MYLLRLGMFEPTKWIAHSLLPMTKSGALLHWWMLIIDYPGTFPLIGRCVEPLRMWMGKGTAEPLDCLG